MLGYQSQEGAGMGSTGIFLGFSRGGGKFSRKREWEGSDPRPFSRNPEGMRGQGLSTDEMQRTEGGVSALPWI